MENGQIKNIITEEGKRKLENELKHLVEIERPLAIAEIKEARAQGDLSENAEYDSAREKQGKIEDRIREINHILETSEVLAIHHHKNKSSNEKVEIGSEVVLQQNKNRKTYQIVGTLEADPLAKPIAKISNESPLAKAILGKNINETVTVDGLKKYDVKIVAIKN